MTSDNCIQQCLCQNSSLVRITCHIPVFAFIMFFGVFFGGGKEWVGRSTKINCYIWLLCKGVCKPTYMPCLSTCRSHAEPSVNDRLQNSHGKHFSRAPLSTYIMDSGREQNYLHIDEHQGKKGPLYSDLPCFPLGRKKSSQSSKRISF